MAKRALRGGLVGCGSVAKEAHMPAWRDEKDAEIVAVCDQSEDAAAEVAGRWGVRGTYREFARMLESEELDFVDVCTPPRTHLEVSAQAMERGLHVVVEKPMAATADEAERMASVAGKHGVKLCVAHNFLLTPAITKSRALVAGGAIGEVIGVDTAMRPSSERLNSEGHWHHDLPGGALHEYTPHVVYMASAFLGKVRAVGAVATKRSRFPWVAADELRVLVESETGVGTLSVCCNQRRYSFVTDVLGTDGILHIDNIAQTITRVASRPTSAAGLVLGRLDSAFQQATAAGSVLANSLLGRKWYKLGHRALFGGFVASIRGGGPPPVTAEDGLETVNTIEQIWGQLGWPAGPRT